VIGFVVGLAATGLIVGALGRLLLLGPDPMTIWETMGIGLAASAISGIAVRLIAGPQTAPGITVTVAVATLLVYLVRRHRQRSHSPG
jgi:mannose/fructose/N-acetylgalactosamine-specific phosphotransferase system component IIC